MNSTRINSVWKIIWRHVSYICSKHPIVFESINRLDLRRGFVLWKRWRSIWLILTPKLCNWWHFGGVEPENAVSKCFMQNSLGWHFICASPFVLLVCSMALEIYFYFYFFDKGLFNLCCHLRSLSRINSAQWNFTSGYQLMHVNFWKLTLEISVPTGKCYFSLVAMWQKLGGCIFPGRIWFLNIYPAHRVSFGQC